VPPTGGRGSSTSPIARSPAEFVLRDLFALVSYATPGDANRAAGPALLDRLVAAKLEREAEDAASADTEHSRVLSAFLADDVDGEPRAIAAE
jgi:hypothetical protein